MDHLAFRRFLIYVSQFCLFMPVTSFAADLDFSVNLGIEEFGWAEFDSGGAQKLKESGTRNFLSGFLGNTIVAKQGFIYQGEAKMYFGTVAYDGQTWDAVPLTTDIRYDGVMLEGEAGYRIENAGGNLAWDIIGRVGVDRWNRDIKKSRDVRGNFVPGYTEEFTILNLRAGTGPSWQTGDWQGRFIAGLKLPITTKEFIGNAFNTDITLQPKGQISFFWNFSNYIRLSGKSNFTFDVFYDSYRFGASDPSDPVVEYRGELTSVSQPKSSQDNYGLRVGVSVSI